jgi:hypothetical protein
MEIGWTAESWYWPLITIKKPQQLSLDYDSKNDTGKGL